MTKAEKINLVYFLLVFLVSVLWACSGTQTLVKPERPSVPLKGLIPQAIICSDNLGSQPLNRPQGLALDNQGNIYIADTGNNRVVRCDSDGNFLKEAGGFGWGEGQFNQPTNLTLDYGLNLYVVDSQNKRVSRYDKNLNFISLIQPEPASEFRGLGMLYGIAVNSAGEIFLSDTENDWLVKLNSFLEYESIFGGFTSGLGAVLNPGGISLDQNGKIYVADSGKRRVVVFDAFGNFLKEFGSEVLQQPQGLTVNSAGEILVADAKKNQILIFNSEGNLIFEFGREGKELGQLLKPVDIKVFQDSQVLVLEQDNNRIQVFQLTR